MKRFITTVAIAATAMAAMAAIAAGPALAGTVLCKTATTTCSSSNVLLKGSSFTTSGAAGGFEIKEDGPLTVRLSCSSNSLSGKTTLRNGNPLSGEFSGEASGCKSNSSYTCGAATMNHPAVSFSPGIKGNGSGTMTIGSTSEPLVISSKCTFPAGEETCTYTANYAINLVSNGTTAGFINSTMAGNGGLCGTSVYLNVPNNTVSGSVFISNATETVVCKTPRSTASPCPNADILPAGNGFGLPFTKFTISSGSNKILSCESGKGFYGGMFGFASNSEAGSPLSAASENGVSPGCTGQYSSGASCSSVDLSDPSTTLVSNSTSSSTVTLGSASEPFTVAFECPSIFGPIKCTYLATGGVPIGINSSFPYGAITNAPVKPKGSAGEGLCLGEAVVLNMEAYSMGPNYISIV